MGTAALSLPQQRIPIFLLGAAFPQLGGPAHSLASLSPRAHDQTGQSESSLRVYHGSERMKLSLHDSMGLKNHKSLGAPGWRSRWASAFGSGRDPGVLGSSPTSGSSAGSLLLPLPLPLLVFPLSLAVSISVE